VSASAPRKASGGFFQTGLWKALDERFQLGNLVEFLGHKEIPIGGHSQVWYYFGGVALFFFTVQIVTGILLLMYYQVGEATSYESMKFLVGHVPFGWLIRSIHCWSAHLMTISVVIHLLSVLFTKAYRKPREITWYSGFALLGIVLAFGFSGYLLPWNELSYFATAVGTDSMKSVPLVGPWLLRVMRGGEEVSAQTLYRFFALHVCILPLVIAGVIGLHLLLIQRQGMAKPLGAHETRRGMPFFPNFVLRDLLLWVICLAVLAGLAVWLPYGPGIPGMEWELGSKANPLKPAYPGIKPEWYFLWIYQMLKEFPAHLLGMEGPQACLLLINVIAVVAVAIPILDRKAARGEESPAITDLAVGGMLFVAMLTLKAWDLGVHVPKGQDPGADPVLAATIARTAAAITIALGALVNIYRWRRFAGATFAFSSCVLLQAVLHGFVGLSWLLSTAACGVVCAVWFGVKAARGGSSSKPTVPPAAALVLLLLLPPALSSGTASGEEPKAAAPAAATASRADVEGHVPDAKWPKAFRDLFDAKEGGKPVLGPKEQERFRSLPAHAQELAFTSLEAGILSSAKHLSTLLALDLDNKKVELLLGDNCVVCHTNPDLPEEILFTPQSGKKGPFSHLNLREVVADVHFRRGLMCSGCHGGTAADKEMSAEIGKRWPASDARKKDRSWIPGFCARCHGSSEFMRQYNPKLPVDQLAKYRTSKHGQLLLDKKDPKAAQCVSCHGVHGIRGPESPLSLVNAANVPATCGRCHGDAEYMKGYTLDDGKTPLPTNQFALYRQSVHGKALLEKHDPGAPACNGCHGNHAALPPETAAVSQVCRNCHANNASMFDGSPHKKAFERNGWPECATCHNTHDIRPASDAMISTAPDGLCGKCHAKYGKPVCNETADFFRMSIGKVSDQAASLDADIEHLGERGFDLDELRFQESSARESLRKTRGAIHTFDRSDFTQNLSAASKEVDALSATIGKFKAEYRFRRSGLLMATALILAFGVLLAVKIRQVDRETGYKG
jgi:cytochrome b6